MNNHIRTIFIGTLIYPASLVFAANIELTNKSNHPIFFIISGRKSDLNDLNTNELLPGKKVVSSKPLNTPTYLLITRDPDGLFRAKRIGGGFISNAIAYTFPIDKNIDVYVDKHGDLKSNANILTRGKIQDKEIIATNVRYETPNLYKKPSSDEPAYRALGVDYTNLKGIDLQLAILGLKKSNNPSLEQIKSAYRRLSRQWHPDKNPSKVAPDVQKLLNAAYEKLTQAK